MKTAIGWTRFIVGLGSFSSIVMGALLFFAAAAEVVIKIIRIIRFTELELGSREGTKELVVAAVEHADTVLIAAALIIIGIGLYALFVGEVQRLPHWLEIESLDDLKDKLVSVVVAVLAVNFFTRVIELEEGTNVLSLGAGIGIVIFSLAAFSGLHVGKKTALKKRSKAEEPK
jgi:uncharacterized membrane protein YqhA